MTLRPFAGLGTLLPALCPSLAQAHQGPDSGDAAAVPTTAAPVLTTLRGSALECGGRLPSSVYVSVQTTFAITTSAFVAGASAVRRNLSALLMPLGLWFSFDRASVALLARVTKRRGRACGVCF